MDGSAGLKRSGYGRAQTDIGGPTQAQMGETWDATQVALTYINTLGDTQA